MIRLESHVREFFHFFCQWIAHVIATPPLLTDLLTRFSGKEPQKRNLDRPTYLNAVGSSLSSRSNPERVSPSSFLKTTPELGVPLLTLLRASARATLASTAGAKPRGGWPRISPVSSREV